MSRHKLVKNLDLDDELDDYDGYDEDAGAEEISADDRRQLQEGTNQVRQILGANYPVTDQEIQESLWHYYYDVEKTTNYLLKSKTPKVPTNTPEKTKGEKGASITNGRHKSPCHFLPFSKTGRSSQAREDFLDLAPYPCPSPALAPGSSHFTAVDFFRDCPWLNVPPSRLAHIISEPLHPRGGLLGGSSGGSGKPSKLAALAARRRKQAEEKAASKESLEPTRAANLLQNLDLEDGGPKTASATSSASKKPSSPSQQSGDEAGNTMARRYISRKHKSSSPDPPKQGQSGEDEMEFEKLEAQEEAFPVQIPKAKPSEFASTLFGMTMAPSDTSKDPPLLHDRFTLVPFSAQIPEDAFSGPSPDDIVEEARKRKGTKSNKNPSAPKKPTKVEQTAIDITAGVHKMAVTEAPPRVKSKNLDVLSEFSKSAPKNAANFVVIGHVDAGKSTLMGRLLYDLKIIPERTLSNYRRDASALGKSSFALAWVMDSTSQERAHGVTMDIATNKFSTATTDFTILDAPGHRDFIPNMIAGASAADFAVLVVDASTGEFESGLQGQTKEHTLLVRSMGVSRLIIAINKLDTVNWSEPRFMEIKQQLTAFLISANFRVENLSFIPCAGLSGDNIVNPSTVPAANWYTGPPLLTLLESSSSNPITRAIDAPLRLPIDDVFTSSAQHPLSISGRIATGSLQIGDQLLALPSNETCAVKAIELGSGEADAGVGEPVEWAVAGQNVILHLNDIEDKYLWQGNVLCDAKRENTIRVVKEFGVKLLAFEHVLPGPVHVHRGRMEVACRIVKLVGVIDRVSTGGEQENGGVGGGGNGGAAALPGGKKKKPKKVRMVKPGQVCRIRVEVEEEGQAVGKTGIPLEEGAKVILRSEGRTIGTGVVE